MSASVVTPGGAVALTDLATWCEECAEKSRVQAARYHEHARVWEEHAATLERSAAQIRGALRIGNPEKTIAKPKPSSSNEIPWNDPAHPIIEPGTLTFDDLPSIPLETAPSSVQRLPLPLEARGSRKYDHAGVEPHDRTPENTHRRLLHVAGLLHPTLSTLERRTRLLEFASDVLGAEVEDLEALRRRDAWKVCRQLEARALDEGIGDRG